MSKYTQWYHRDITRSRKLAAAKKRRKAERITALVRGYKEQPCADCGIQYPYYVMDLDHSLGEKLEMISTAAQGWIRGVAFIINELSKCDPVCANCHRERTQQRMLWKKGEAYIDRLPNFV